MKLLYAEDEKALSMAVAEILKMEGFDVDAVYSGDEAYNSICNGTYDGIILDIMMRLWMQSWPQSKNLGLKCLL